MTLGEKTKKIKIMTNGPPKPIWIYMIVHYINQEDKTFCIYLKTALRKRAYVPICVCISTNM